MLLAFGVVAYRAATQSVTIDEADSYLLFAAGSLGDLVYPSSGNHVGNTLIVRAFVELFGLSVLTLRSGALIGAAIYLISTWSLAGTVARAWALRLLVFGVFALNPFVLDYLVASRGYSLAIGLLAAALAISAGEGGSRNWRAVGISLCCGLAFAANFAFAFAAAAVVASFFLFAAHGPPGKALKLALLCLLPGAAAASAVVGSTVLNWPKGQLYFGADSWTATWTSLLDATFVASIPLAGALQDNGPFTPIRQHALWLLWIPIAAAAVSMTRMVRLLALALGLTLLAHLTAFHAFGILLPLDRTGIFLALFVTAIMSFSVTGTPAGGWRRWLRTASICVLAGTLFVFLATFRTSYFRMWFWNADVDRGYAALQHYGRTHALGSVGCEWRFHGAYSFYRKMNSGSLPECVKDIPVRGGHSAYLLFGPDAGPVIAAERLRILYSGELSGLVVAAAEAPATPVATRSEGQSGMPGALESRPPVR